MHFGMAPATFDVLLMESRFTMRPYVPESDSIVAADMETSNRIGRGKYQRFVADLEVVQAV